MSPDQLDRALKDLPRTGTRVKVRPYREVWRVEIAGKPYYLKFYPRDAAALKRLVRGSPALREFVNLQAMQRAGVPAPRAVAHLSGFSIEDRKGDAVIIEGIEPSRQLDHYLNALLLDGRDAPDHRDLARQIIDILQKLGRAKLGHADLHLGNFLLHDGKLFLLDGYAVHAGGLSTRDLQLLAHSVSRFATRTDVLRGWNTLASGPVPKKNAVRKRQWRKFLESSTTDNAYFSRLRFRDWTGHACRHAKFPRRWSRASQLTIAPDEWPHQLETILDRLDRDDLEILKRSRSGDVFGATLTLANRPLDVVIKRPRHRRWYRYLNEIGRGGRARRAWTKAWSLIVRDIPTAWPLAVLERRTLGYVTDSFIIFERVRGTLLSDLDFDALAPESRRTLFHRLGRTLRLLEAQGLHQYDSKSTNWIIADDAPRGPTPVIIDVDGIRRIVPPLGPIDRLLRSLREHADYTPEDSKWVCIGYAPNATLVQEGLSDDDADDGEGGDDDKADDAGNDDAHDDDNERGHDAHGNPVGATPASPAVDPKSGDRAADAAPTEPR